MLTVWICGNLSKHYEHWMRSNEEFGLCWIDQDGFEAGRRVYCCELRIRSRQRDNEWTRLEHKRVSAQTSNEQRNNAVIDFKEAALRNRSGKVEGSNVGVLGARRTQEDAITIVSSWSRRARERNTKHQTPITRVSRTSGSQSTISI